MTALTSVPHDSRPSQHHSEHNHGHVEQKLYLHSSRGRVTYTGASRENLEEQWLDFSWVFQVALQRTQQRFVGMGLIRFVLRRDLGGSVPTPPGRPLQWKWAANITANPSLHQLFPSWLQQWNCFCEDPFSCISSSLTNKNQELPPARTHPEELTFTRILQEDPALKSCNIFQLYRFHSGLQKTSLPVTPLERK